MKEAWRLPSGGLVDRGRRLRFRFNGRDYCGYAGDTLASALLANGVRLAGRSFKYHRPRGLVGSGVEESNILVRLEAGGAAEPNLKATEIELVDGLEAASVNCWPNPAFDLRAVNQLAAPLLGAGFYYKTFMWPNWHRFEPAIRRAAGLGVAPDTPDPDRYVHAHAACDLLVVGGGPTGLAEALAAAKAGRDVLLAESDFRLGGSALWRDDRGIAAGLEAELREHANVRILTRTNVFGHYDHNALAAVERLSGEAEDGTASPEAFPPGPTAAQRLWKIRASEVVLATGAIERPLVFANNDRPGVMLASAVQAYIRRWGVLPGKRAVVFTNNDSAYEVARALRDAGVAVTIVDSRKRPESPCLDGVQSLSAHVVTAVRGGRTVRGGDGCAGGRRVRKGSAVRPRCHVRRLVSRRPPLFAVRGIAPLRSRASGLRPRSGGTAGSRRRRRGR